MALLQSMRALLTDPGSEYVFEISAGGLAWVETSGAVPRFLEIPEGALAINPVKPNFTDPAQLRAAIDAAVPSVHGQHARRAAIVLPDYCARVAVLDFDSFPAVPEEQIALARFRIKRTVPFDIEGALIACQPQPRRDGGKAVDVVTVAISNEIAAQYLQPFRAAGFQCGVITVSGIAALALRDPVAEHPQRWLQVKRAGRVLTVCLLDRGDLRMFRSVELDHATVDEMMEVLAPTLAYAEDEFGGAPQLLRLCGFAAQDNSGETLAAELGLPVCRVSSPLAAAGEHNSGLLGMLADMEVRA